MYRILSFTADTRYKAVYFRESSEAPFCADVVGFSVVAEPITTVMPGPPETWPTRVCAMLVDPQGGSLVVAEHLQHLVGIFAHGVDFGEPAKRARAIFLRRNQPQGEGDR